MGGAVGLMGVSSGFTWSQRPSPSLSTTSGWFTDAGMMKTFVLAGSTSEMGVTFSSLARLPSSSMRARRSKTWGTMHPSFGMSPIS